MNRAELREAMQEQGDGPGYLVPPGVVVEIAVRLGMPPLPDRMRWDTRVRAAIGYKPRWWKWLFYKERTKGLSSKIASFLVWRWPKFPGIVKAHDECFLAHQAEGERRVQKAYEYLCSRTEKDGAVTLKATIGNFAEYRYCTMKVAEGDDGEANLD